MKVRVYTETTVHAADGSYQLAIVELPHGERQTVRITGPRVSIGDELDWPQSETVRARRQTPGGDPA